MGKRIILKEGQSATGDYGDEISNNHINSCACAVALSYYSRTFICYHWPGFDMRGLEKFQNLCNNIGGPISKIIITVHRPVTEDKFLDVMYDALEVRKRFMTSAFQFFMPKESLNRSLLTTINYDGTTTIAGIRAADIDLKPNEDANIE